MLTAVASADSVSLAVSVNTSKAVLTLPPTYLGFTLDWWPPTDPEGFGTSSVLHIDFKNPRLRGLVGALGPVLFRVGGSLDNIVQYLTPGVDSSWCNRTQLFRGQHYQLCLTPSRWMALLDFAATALAPQSGFVFGLQLDLSEPASWNGTNVLAFLSETALMQQVRDFYDERSAIALQVTLCKLLQASITAFEVGEETTPEPGTPAFDAFIGAYRSIHDAVERLWPSLGSRPAVRGPCTGMNENSAPFNWTSAFIRAVLVRAS
jgi:hypothetical protein